MAVRNKILFAVLVITGLTVSGAVWGYYAWQNAGTLIVEVFEKGPGGDAVSIEIPGIVIPLAVNMMPEVVIRECSDNEDLQQVFPILSAIADELKKMPDAEIVSVQQGNEFVVIEKRGSNLIIDVDNDSETVHVSIPISAVSAFCKKMEKSITITHHSSS